MTMDTVDREHLATVLHLIHDMLEKLDERVREIEDVDLSDLHARVTHLEIGAGVRGAP